MVAFAMNYFLLAEGSAGIASVKGTVFAVKVDSSKGMAEFFGKTGSFEVESLISGEVLSVDGLQKITANINKKEVYYENSSRVPR